MYLNLLRLLRYFGTNWPYFFSNGVFPTDAINHVDINFHGVNVAQAIKSEAVAFRYTHDEADVDSTRQRIATVDEYHGRVSGIFSADEHMAGKMPERGSELVSQEASAPYHSNCYSKVHGGGIDVQLRICLFTSRRQRVRRQS